MSAVKVLMARAVGWHVLQGASPWLAPRATSPPILTVTGHHVFFARFFCVVALEGPPRANEQQLRSDASTRGLRCIHARAHMQPPYHAAHWHMQPMARAAHMQPRGSSLEPPDAWLNTCANLKRVCLTESTPRRRGLRRQARRLAILTPDYKPSTARPRVRRVATDKYK